MTNTVSGASLGHPQAVVTLVDNFADTGLTVTGLPTGWRKVRRDADLVTVSDLWLSESEALQQESLAPSERFVSNAMASAWRISDLEATAEDLLAFAEAMTTGVPGWELREESVDTDGMRSVLLGSLKSPFGTLVSNAHSVVIPVGDAEFILAQLAVTARPPYVDGVDEPRLTLSVHK